MVPQGDYLLSTLNLSTCVTTASAECSRKVLHEELKALGSVVGDDSELHCMKPCTSDYFDHHSLTPQLGMGLDGYAFFSVRFASLDVVVSEESLLYDLNTIVSAVGGSLRLFLGLSCYAVVEAAAERAFGLFSMHMGRPASKTIVLYVHDGNGTWGMRLTMGKASTIATGLCIG